MRGRQSVPVVTRRPTGIGSRAIIAMLWRRQSAIGARRLKDATFDYAGIRSRFFLRDGKYYVATDNAQGKIETFHVSYTFGTIRCSSI